MPVGNDVVDLRDPAGSPTALHPRFDDRVFGDPELALIRQSPPGSDSHTVRWILWAAKESALKLARQIDAAIPFRPRTFEVRLGTAGSGDVTFRGSVFPIVVDVTPERVHVVATDRASAGRTVSGVDRLKTRPATDASAQVRACAVRTVARCLGLEADGIAIEDAIPRVMRKGARLNVEISLSHHGRFVAHSVLPGSSAGP